MKTVPRRAPVALAVAAITAWSAAAGAQPLPRPRAPRELVGPPHDVIVYEERRPNAALISSGAGMLTVSYGASLLVATMSENPADQQLFIPVAGPWMDLARRAECTPWSCPPGETASKVMLAADGLLQAAGALQILGGFLFPETRTVTRAGRLHVTPKVGRGMVGLSASGTF